MSNVFNRKIYLNSDYKNIVRNLEYFYQVSKKIILKHSMFFFWNCEMSKEKNQWRMKTILMKTSYILHLVDLKAIINHF